MPLQLKNRWEFVEEDWWNWEAFVDGTERELDEVKQVEYILHHTFEEPVRVVISRSNKFLMRTEGWGEFKLRAYVTKKNGKVVKLQHDIQLRSSPAKGESV